MGQIHRHRDSASIWSGTGETVYMTAETARTLAAGLIAIADSIDRETFASSPGLTLSFETFDNSRSLPKADREPKARPAVPADYAVQPLVPDSTEWAKAEMAGSLATCGECGRAWNDGISTSMTPAPAGRCPFEYYH